MQVQRTDGLRYYLSSDNPGVRSLAQDGLPGLFWSPVGPGYPFYYLGDLNEKYFHKLMYFNTWSPTGGAVWGDDGTFRRRSHAGGSVSLGVSSEGL